MWQPNIGQMATPIRIYSRVSTNVKGAPDISYEPADPPMDCCNWKGRGGSERIDNGTATVVDTAELTMWYRPDVTEQTHILRGESGDDAYEVTNVENVEERGQYMIVKVLRVVNA